MDALLSRLSYHATSYAIRSCVALTSTLLLQQGSRLLKTVDDDPLRAELAGLQRRLARKIELISPVLESIEFRFTRGNAALEAVVRTARELRGDIDALATRLQNAAFLEEKSKNDTRASSTRQSHDELLAILAEMKQLIVSIDDSIPLINLWVSAIGGIQAESAAFSPSRLLQASMLVNIGDTQYTIDPAQTMQIGPDFTLSLYMLFRGHASAQDGEAYGIEDGQRKPMWQEVIHKARVRLYRVPPTLGNAGPGSPGQGSPLSAYTYQLQIVEDLDDGRVHTFEDGNARPGPYDGLPVAGVREAIPVGQISRMFYADVGRILNINNEDGASSNPVLLIKRAVQQLPPDVRDDNDGIPEQKAGLIEGVDESSMISDYTLSETSPQDEIDRQLREESQVVEMTRDSLPKPDMPPLELTGGMHSSQWSLPHNLDPEWMALEVFEFDDSSSSFDEDDTDPAPEEDDLPTTSKPQRPQAASRTSVDSNLMAQLHRMSLASNSVPSSRPSSSHSQPSNRPSILSPSTDLTRHDHLAAAPLSPTRFERSPFSAIKTSLSLLEMLLRVTSLQEFEQMTHLAIPDHVLNFYLDESASESGLHGKEPGAARAGAARTVGFDPYADAPGGGGGAAGRM
ncbi:RanGTP-binding protein [Xylariales sp. AK1849]|nr:RanGTP-binding protein [Xylariales sp. AK1849]